jgi:hypothetical protein
MKVLCRVGSKALDNPGDGTILDAHVTTFCPSKPSQFLRERRDWFGTALRGPQQHADPPHALALLRARRELPRRRRAAEKRDELASFHCQCLPGLQ